MLPFASALMNLVWEIDKYVYDNPVGELWDGYGRRANWIRTPPGIDGQKFCGPIQSFQQGQDYDPDETPAYGANGWLLCCGRIPVITGGAGAGGNCPPTAAPAIAVYGGGGGAGQCSVSVSDLDATLGGWSLSAAAADLASYTDVASGGYSLAVAVGDRSGGMDVPAGGFSVGAFVGDYYGFYDPVQGGWSLGGSTGDYHGYYDQVQGGWSLGGSTGDYARYTDATLGGWCLRANVLDHATYSDACAGGWALGGSLADLARYTDVPGGSMGLGGQSGDDLVGSLVIENETGGPFSFSGTITLVGGTGVTLVPGTNQVTINTVGSPAPGNPTSLTPTAESGQVALTWTAPTGAPGAASYNVYYSTSATMSGATLFGNFSTTSATVTGLTNNTTYYFGVVAVSAGGGVSGYSNIASATPSAFLIQDLFGRAAGTLTGTSPSPTNTPGNTWQSTTVNSATTHMNTSGSNTAVQGAGDSFGNSISIISAGTDNCYAQVTVAATGSGTYQMLCLRWASTSSGVYVGKDGSNFVVLVAGGSTLYSAAYTPAVNDVWKANWNGTTNLLTVFLNGTTVYSGTVTGISNPNFGIYVVDATAAFKDFIVGTAT